MEKSSTEVITVDPLHPAERELARAANLIKAGQVVAFPTETVYGLGADATNGEAVKRIYKAKHRPQDNPLIAHFARFEDIKPYVTHIPELAERLAKQFWPGPLTMVLKKTDRISTQVTHHLDTVAVRVPAHQVALSFIRLCGVPLAAPSANLSGRPSPTTATHVLHDLDGDIPMIIDGGSTSIGVESTVINLTETPPVLLRPGGITIEELQEVIPDLVVPKGQEVDTPISPGMKYTHYSPRTRLLLLRKGHQQSVTSIDQLARSQEKKTLILCTNPQHDHQQEALLLGDNLMEVQVNLFASLRLLDDRDHDIGIFEGVEDSHEGYTVMNRVKKAAHGTISIETTEIHHDDEY